MNKVCLEINNCCDCPNHYIERVYTADPWEHESGVFCYKVKDESSENRKHKMVVSDGYNLRKWSNIPDWCPLLSNK